MKGMACKRITALVLALMMTLSLLPMNVWAEELQQTEYEPLYLSDDAGMTYDEAQAASYPTYTATGAFGWNGVCFFTGLEGTALTNDGTFSLNNGVVNGTVIGDAKTVYLAVSENSNLSVTKAGSSTNLVVQQDGMWQDFGGNMQKLYTLTLETPANGDTVEYFVERTIPGLTGADIFTVNIEFVPEYTCDGDIQGMFGIFAFADMDGHKLICDESILSWGSGEEHHMYIACDDVASKTIYLAANKWHTLSVSGVSDLTKVGAWVRVGINDNGERFEEPCNVYALTAEKPETGNTAEYTVTDSWSWYDGNDQPQSRSESFTLTLNFAPILTGEMRNMERGVAIFSELENGVLGYDAEVSGGNSGAYVSAAGKTSQKVYLATFADRTLSVSDGIALEQVGVWYTEGGNGRIFPCRVYEMTVEKGASNTETYTVRAAYSADDYEEFELAVDFTPGYDISGDFYGTRGVILFTDMENDSFSCDTSAIMQWGDTAGEHMYVNSGNVSSDKVYLAVNPWDTLSVDGSGILSEKIGTVPIPCRDDQESWIETYNVYELTVQKPANGGTVNHTVTRSWTWLENGEEHSGSDSFTLHLDFSPELTMVEGEARYESGVAILTKLAKGVLSQDSSVKLGFYPDRAEVLCLEKTSQNLYLSVPVSNNLSVKDAEGTEVALKQVGVVTEITDNGYSFFHKVYELKAEKPDDASVDKYTITHSWMNWEDGGPVPVTMSSALAVDFSEVLTGQVHFGNWDVGIFTDLDGTKLSDDDSIMQWFDTIYVVCGDVDSRTVYLTDASHADLTLTPENGTTIYEQDMKKVGKWIDEWGQAKDVYAITVEKPANGDTVTYDAVRTWTWYDDETDTYVEESAEIHFTFDFAPVLTGEAWVGNAGVYTFTDLENGVLSNDESVLGTPYGQTVICGGVDEKTVYLATSASDVLTVKDKGVNVPLERVGLLKEVWEYEGETYTAYNSVYELTVDNANADISELVVTRQWDYYDDKGTWDDSTDDEIIAYYENFHLTFDFYMQPNQCIPLHVNGLRIYSFCDDDGWLGYMNGDTFDEMAASGPTTVQVPGRPCQDKTVYLVSTKALTLTDNSVGATLVKHGSVADVEGYDIYRLTVPAKENGTSAVKVSDGVNTTTFNVWFTSVVFNRTSFYTTVDENGYLTYTNREICDGVRVEWLDLGNPDENHLCLKVPFDPSQDKVLYIQPNDGDISSIQVGDGEFAKDCEFEELSDMPGVYKLTIKAGQGNNGNVVLLLCKRDNFGDEWAYSAVDVLFEENKVTLSNTDYKVNLFENWEEPIFVHGFFYDITDATFADAALNELFDITVVEDNVLLVTLVGEPADGDWAAWGKEFAGKYSSGIKLYYSDTEFCLSEEMNFTLTASVPKVTAGAVKFNSFIAGDTQPVGFTCKDAVVVGVTLDENKDNPAWVVLNEDDSVTLVNEALANNKASGKLYLNVWLEGYCAPAQVTVSVSAAFGAPKLKLDKSTVTLIGRAAYQEPVELTLVSSDKNFDISKVTAISVDNDAYTAEYLGAGKFLLDTVKDVTAGKINLLVTIAGGADTVKVPLTVKISAPTVKASTTKVTLNTAMGAGMMRDEKTVTFSGNIPEAWYSDVIWEIIAPKGGSADMITVESNGNGMLTIYGNEGIVDGSYKVNVTVGAAKPVAITVTAKAAALKLKPSASSATLNLAMGVGADEKFITIASGNEVYDIVGFGSSTEVSIAGPADGGELYWQMVNNQLYLTTSENTTVGSYKVTITNTMPGGQQISCSLTVKVESKMPTLKPDVKSLSLDRTYGIATVNVAGIDGFAVGELVAEPTVDGITVEMIDHDSFAVTVDETLDKKGGKINVYYKLSDTAQTKPVAITVKPVDKISVTASVKGNMDMTRPETTTSNFTFKYTGWYAGVHVYEPARLPGLYWEVYAANGKQGAITGEQGAINNSENGLVATGEVGRANGIQLEDNWFKNVSTDPYGVKLQINTDSEAWAMSQINPKYTYTVAFKLMFDNGDEDPSNNYTYTFPKTVKLTVKQGSTKFAADTKAVTVEKAQDALSEAFVINGTDKDKVNVADIAMVAVAANKKPNAFAVVETEDGYAIKVIDPALAKNGSVKLNIWLEGNYADGCEEIWDTKDLEYRKPNATVSLKVTVK